MSTKKQKKVQYKYNWQPDLPDHRDHAYVPKKRGLFARLAPVVDLRPKCPPVYDQGQLGSCTGNAIAGAFHFESMKQGKPLQPSRLFIYYNERVLENDVNDDNGAVIRDGLKTVAKQGVCSEDSWPYIVKQFTKKPPQQCYTEAAAHLAVKYQRLDQTLDAFRSCLADGNPIVFGFSVFSGFESPEVAKTGMLNMPQRSEKDMGGHAVLCVGYDDTKQRFTVRNSWGPSWGLQGYFTMPYEYMTSPNLADDFWTIQAIE